MIRHVNLAGQKHIRRLGGALSIGMLTALLAGCGTNTVVAAAHAKGSTHKTVITYMIWDHTQEPAYQNIIKAFEKQYPSINVTIELVPWSEYWTKLYTEAAAGDAPDVFWAMPAYFKSLISNHVVLSQASLIKASHITVPNAIPQLNSALDVNGFVVGMEQDWDALGYYYNLSDLKKVGLSHVPSRLTWNPTNGGGLLKLAEKLTVASNGTHPGQAGFNPDDIVQYGFVWTNSSVGPYDMSPWLHSNGGTIVTSTGKLEINSPQNIQTVQFIKNLIYKYHVSPQIEPMISATPYALFVGGRAAIWQSGPWELATLKAQAPFPFGISMTAAGPDGSWTRSNTLVNAIYAKTKHEHDAWLFVKFIEGPKAQAILAGAGDEVPASPAGYNKWKAHWAKEGINVEPFIKATHDNGGRVATDPDVPNFPEFSDVWYADMEKILSNKIGVAAGMNLLQKQEEAVIHGKSAT